jgi:hypothetical protein
MALFTVILEFDGGTYISQFHASSPKNAAMKHSAHLVGIKGVSTPATRRRLADRLSSEVPVEMVQFCTFPVWDFPSRPEDGIGSKSEIACSRQNESSRSGHLGQFEATIGF